MITLLAIVLVVLVPAALVAWVRQDRFSVHSPHVTDLGRPDDTWPVRPA